MRSAMSIRSPRPTSIWPTAAICRPRKSSASALRDDARAAGDAIHLALLEVYAKRRDARGFEQLAISARFAETHGSGEDWARAQELGRQSRCRQSAVPAGRRTEPSGPSGREIHAEPMDASSDAGDRLRPLSILHLATEPLGVTVDMNGEGQPAQPLQIRSDLIRAARHAAAPISPDRARRDAGAGHDGWSRRRWRWTSICPSRRPTSAARICSSTSTRWTNRRQRRRWPPLLAILAGLRSLVDRSRTAG